ncbi:hypothetical protein SK128_010484 [Halocaridina rubra]|uniref:Uncharacterized protein n=1 Tax=Halocaridina rubra TaxID=373956 RepID=A0AAN9FWT8_HALRR
MLLYARKKFLRDDRMLQLVLLLSLLRGDPDSFLLGPDSTTSFAHLPHDLILGSSLGHARPSSPSFMTADLHPKSLDRLLADYQRSVLEDLNALGRYSNAHHTHVDVHAYLLNTHSSLPSPPTADTPEHHHQGPTNSPNILPDPPPEPNLAANDLTPEDLALIEALWKQDVDLGIPREVYDDEDLETFTSSPTKDKDHGKKPKGDTEVDEKPEDNSWLQFNFTVDSETGEWLLSNENPISGGDVTLDPASPLATDFSGNIDSDFNLEFNLDEALKLVGLNCSETGETVWKATESKDNEVHALGDKSIEDSQKEESDEDSLDLLNDTLDDMIQASQLHPQHPRSLQVMSIICILCCKDVLILSGK